MKRLWKYDKRIAVIKKSGGGRFNFLLTPMGGLVGVKPAALGFFLVQSGRFLV